MRYISHEIRTPLSTVFMGLNLLQKELGQSKANAKHVGTVKEVKASAEIALGVLNDMLLYDKIEGGIAQLDRSDVRPLSLVKSVMRPFSLQVVHSLNYY